MATVFDSHFAGVGFPALLSQFGESITYLPGDGGVREITAIVDRDPPAVWDAAGNAVLPELTIRVYDSCRSGIAANELDSGTDEIELYLKNGDQQPSKFSVMQWKAHSGGVVQLAIK